MDRFLGLVVHVVNHSASSRSMRLTAEDREDMVSAVFLAIVKDDLSVLRNFRGESSLATYLTVVARRVVVPELLRQKSPARLAANGSANSAEVADEDDAEARSNDRDEIERLLEELNGTEAEVVRQYHLEGKTYQEISSSVGVPMNSVGPTLTRARRKMRSASSDAASER